MCVCVCVCENEEPSSKSWTRLFAHHCCSGLWWLIHLYLPVPENFNRPIFLNRLWFMHIPFVSTVKINLLPNIQRITFITKSYIIFLLYIKNKYCVKYNSIISNVLSMGTKVR